MDKSWRREKIQSIELGSIFAAGLKSAQCGNVFRMPLGTLGTHGQCYLQKNIHYTLFHSLSTYG